MDELFIIICACSPCAYMADVLLAVYRPCYCISSVLLYGLLYRLVKRKEGSARMLFAERSQPHFFSFCSMSSSSLAWFSRTIFVLG